jgi:mannose-1-phosphate guanylyltransferase
MSVLTVVLAGGSGTRLWPLSTDERPKWALQVGGRSLLAAAVDRAVGPVVVITAAGRGDLARAALDGRAAEVWEEPRPRSTLAPVLWAGEVARSRGFTHLLVLPADHLLDDAPAFRAVVAAATGADPCLIAVRPDAPDEGLGWMVLGTSDPRGLFTVERFVEKPAPAEAAALFHAGARWNMGVFVLPVAWTAALAARVAPGVTLDHDPGRWWAEIPCTSLDYGALESARDLRAVLWDGAWSDLGTWSAFAAAAPVVGDGRGDASKILAFDAPAPWVFAPGREVVVLGADVLIVEVDSRLFVADRRALAGLQDARRAVVGAAG